MRGSRAVALVLLLAIGACGRNKTPGEIAGSGGNTSASGGHTAASGGRTGSGGAGGATGGAVAGTGGGGGGRPGTGGRAAPDAGAPDAGIPLCPSTAPIPTCGAQSEGWNCELPATHPCQMCIGGSRMLAPEEITRPVAVICTCQNGIILCPDGPLPPNWSPVGDCHVETDLACAAAKTLFVDDNCTEPAPCTP